MASHCAIDLDPMPGVTFDTVLDVARWVRDELVKLNVTGYPKTSGASGVHIYIPLREGTPYEAGQIFCQIVATYVAEKHPKVATVTRAVRARGRKKSTTCGISKASRLPARTRTRQRLCRCVNTVDLGRDRRASILATTQLDAARSAARVGDLRSRSSIKGVDLRSVVK
jgi:hypothetical protein